MLDRVAVLACACAVLLGSAQATRAQAVAASCDVRIRGTSTLHDFEGRAPCSRVEIEGPSAGPFTARVVVALAQLTTDNSARDERMREMFAAERYPTLEARFASIDLAALRAAARDATATPALAFRLRVREREVDVAPVLLAWSEARDGSATLAATFDLSLKQLGLEAPVVLGLLRVDDRVAVEVRAAIRGLGEASVSGGSPGPASPDRAPRRLTIRIASGTGTRSRSRAATAVAPSPRVRSVTRASRSRWLRWSSASRPACRGARFDFAAARPGLQISHSRCSSRSRTPRC
jgi:hypothetical protein